MRDRPEEVHIRLNASERMTYLYSGESRRQRHPMPWDRPVPVCAKCLAPLKQVNDLLCCDACGAQYEGIVRGL